MGEPLAYLLYLALLLRQTVSVEATKSECSDEFNELIDCFRQRLELVSSMELEKELHDNRQQQIQECFQPSLDSSSVVSEQRCLFRPNGFDGDFFRKRDSVCPRCQQVATFLEQEILLGNPRVSQCVAQAFHTAITEESMGCLRRRHNQLPFQPEFPFGRPQLQVGAANDTKRSEQIVRLASLHMTARGRLDLCRRLTKGGVAYVESRSCYDWYITQTKRHRLTGFTPYHHDAYAHCFKRSTGRCNGDSLRAMLRPSCGCLRHRRSALRHRLKSVGKLLRGPAKTDRHLCVNTVLSVFKPGNGTNYADWLTTLDRLFGQCAMRTPSVNHRVLIDDGCRLLVAKKRIGPLKRAVNMIANFIDFYIERFGRYCSTYYRKV